MPAQQDALNGKPLTYSIWVDGNMLDLLGLKELPRGMIGFDFDKGEARVKVSPDAKPIKMRIGKLLNKAGIPPKEQTTVGANAKAISIACNTKLQFATTEEEILRVYRDGPHSCMANSDSVRVYATADIAVAYIELDGKILARATVSVKDKRYATTYGIYQPLERLLEAEGFVNESEPLVGCRIKAIKDEHGMFIAPFIDGSELCSVLDDDYLIIDNCGDMMCQDTGGTIQYQECSECGTLSMDYNEEYEVCQEDGAVICKHCQKSHYVKLHNVWYRHTSDSIVQMDDGEYELIEDAAYVEEHDSYYYPSLCVHNNYTGNYHLRTDLELDND